MARAIDILTMGEPLMEFSEQERDGVRVYLPGHGGDTSNCAVAAAQRLRRPHASPPSATTRSAARSWRSGTRKASTAPGCWSAPTPARGSTSSVTARTGTRSATTAPGRPRASSPLPTCRPTCGLSPYPPRLRDQPSDQPLGLRRRVPRDPPRQAGRCLGQLRHQPAPRFVAAGPRPRGHPRSSRARRHRPAGAGRRANSPAARRPTSATITWASGSRSWR